MIKITDWFWREFRTILCFSRFSQVCLLYLKMKLFENLDFLFLIFGLSPKMT